MVSNIPFDPASVVHGAVAVPTIFLKKSKGRRKNVKEDLDVIVKLYVMSCRQSISHSVNP
jgi:hypothetical protein